MHIFMHFKLKLLLLIKFVLCQIYTQSMLPKKPEESLIRCWIKIKIEISA